MRLKHTAPLMLVVCAATLAHGPAFSAAQRPSEMPLYNDMERFLSPNELQLAELQRERQDLMKSRQNEKNARILKNKITILNNKIAFLQRQIKLTRPHMVTQRLVPLDVKSAQSAQRLEPAAAPAPVFLASKSPAGATIRENAAAAPQPVVVVQLLPVNDAAPRAAGGTQVLPAKIEQKSFAPASLRAAAQELPAPAKPVVAAKPKALPAAERKPGSGKTGAEWKKMELADKEIYILSVMGNLSRRDVYLMKPYGFYIKMIDEAIEKNPLLENEHILRILMTTAYDSEPDTRKDLEKVWK